MNKNSFLPLYYIEADLVFTTDIIHFTVANKEKSGAGARTKIKYVQLLNTGTNRERLSLYAGIQIICWDSVWRNNPAIVII